MILPMLWNIGTQLSFNTYTWKIKFVHHSIGIGKLLQDKDDFSIMALGPALQSIYNLHINKDYNREIRILASSI